MNRSWRGFFVFPCLGKQAGEPAADVSCP
jgi:hypothetical protein